MAVSSFGKLHHSVLVLILNIFMVDDFQKGKGPFLQAEQGFVENVLELGVKMSLHSSGVRAIDEVIHVDDEVLVVEFFALIGFDQAYHLLAFVEQSFLCFFCLVVRIFVRIKLQKTDEVV
jgi:hypothetical protein